MCPARRSSHSHSSTIDGAATPPVRALPKATHHERLYGGIAERGGRKVARVIGLRDFVGSIDIEFGDLELHAECRVAVEPLERFVHGGDARGEMALQADSIEGRLLVDQA